MNSTPEVLRSALAAGRMRQLTPTSFGTIAPLTRAALPVLGNRAFVAAWAARRNRLAAAARLARCN